MKQQIINKSGTGIPATAQKVILETCLNSEQRRELRFEYPHKINSKTIHKARIEYTANRRTVEVWEFEIEGEEDV